MERYADYDPMAWVYNRHFNRSTLEKFTPIVEALLVQELMPGSHILDLCCGTGVLAGWLTERGYRVTGVDGSGAMLAHARQNAPEASFMLADARSFTVSSLCDAVVSTYDSLNHILEDGGLAAAFHNSYDALLPGGVLLCDLNIRSGFVERWKSDFSIIEEDNVSIVRTRYDDEARLAYWDMTIFRLQGSWERSDFTLIQRAYDEGEIYLALEAAGFREIHIFDLEHPPAGLSVQHGRAFFLARKGTACSTE